MTTLTSDLLSVQERKLHSYQLSDDSKRIHEVTRTLKEEKKRLMGRHKTFYVVPSYLGGLLNDTKNQGNVIAVSDKVMTKVSVGSECPKPRHNQRISYEGNTRNTHQ